MQGFFPILNNLFKNLISEYSYNTDHLKKAMAIVEVPFIIQQQVFIGTHYALES